MQAIESASQPHPLSPKRFQELDTSLLLGGGLKWMSGFKKPDKKL